MRCSIVMLPLLALGAGPLHAQQTDATEMPPSEPEFHSRLFTTPEQRQRLDRLRERRASRSAQRATEKVVVKKPPPPLPRVEVKGVVIRSQGPATAWVNDGNTLRGERLADGLRVSTDAQGRATIVLPNDRALVLEPGQSYDPASGRTTGIRIQKSQ